MFLPCFPIRVLNIIGIQVLHLYQGRCGVGGQPLRGVRASGGGDGRGAPDRASEGGRWLEPPQEPRHRRRLRLAVKTTTIVLLLVVAHRLLFRT